MVSVSGVRGRVGATLTPELMAGLAAAFGAFVRREDGDGPVYVGMDSRTSGPMFVRAVVAGLQSVGVPVIDLGMVPTPTLLLAVRRSDAIGGIAIEYGKRLGDDISLEQLAEDYDAVFLAMGMGAVNGLGLDGEDMEGVDNAIDYIAELRQAPDLSSLEVGRGVVVIGGGMTAIDIADQSKRLGAEHVTLVYRRDVERMAASA